MLIISKESFWQLQVHFLYTQEKSKLVINIAAAVPHLHLRGADVLFDPPAAVRASHARCDAKRNWFNWKSGRILLAVVSVVTNYETFKCRLLKNQLFLKTLYKMSFVAITLFDHSY